jgi:uncharacterized protein
MPGETITIGGVSVAPGERRGLSLPAGMLHTRVPVEMPVWVINGRRAGPRLFISAAIHGDELNGIEIIRRIRARPLAGLRGTLLLVPVVNVFGLLHHARYLPDRRDLNRSFPGSERGSLAARLAHLFMNEIVARCTHGIDLHTGASTAATCRRSGRSSTTRRRARWRSPSARRSCSTPGCATARCGRRRRRKASPR